MGKTKSTGMDTATLSANVEGEGAPTAEELITYLSELPGDATISLDRRFSREGEEGNWDLRASWERPIKSLRLGEDLVQGKK